MRIHHRQRQCGFSLLEMSVAAAILAFGFSGLAALLISSVTQSAFSAHRTQAVLLSESLAAQLEMAGSGMPVGDFAEAALRAWRSQLRQALPSGSGLVCRDSTPEDGEPDAPACDGSGPRTVKIFWRGTGREWAQHALPLGS